MAKDKGILFTDDMELDIKVVRDDEGKIVSGFSIGDVTLQNQRMIIMAQKGEIKEDPLIGVNANGFAESNDLEGFAREIRSQLTRDGQTIKSISVKIPNVKVESSYES